MQEVDRFDEPTIPPPWKQTARRPRKFALNPAVHKITSLKSQGGDPDCAHDFDQRPARSDVSGDTWICTLCAREFSCERWPAIDEREAPRE